MRRRRSTTSAPPSTDSAPRTLSSVPRTATSRPPSTRPPRSVKENGKTLSANTEKGRANQQSLDAIRQATLDKVNADYALNESTSEATATMQRGRDAFIKAAIAAGSTKTEAKKLADQLGLIPGNVAIAVKQTGAEGAGEAIDYAARDRTATIRVKQQIAEFKASQVSGVPKRRAGGGSIYGPGTKTSDSVPLWGSAGEFMQRAAAVDKYGLSFMHAVNSLQFPTEFARGFAGGGEIQPAFAPRQHVVKPPVLAIRPHPAHLRAAFQVNGADAYEASRRAMREFEFRVVSGL